MTEQEQHGVEEREYIVALGLPKGVVHDATSGEAVGLIRLGGQVVDSMSLDLYHVWTHYLIPRPVEEVPDPRNDPRLTNQDSLERLLSLGFLLKIKMGSGLGKHLADLKPLPLGYAIGNEPDEADSFVVEMPGRGAVTLDALGKALWVSMDGNLTLREIISETSAWFNVESEILENGLIYTVLLLMGGRCLYLDRALRNNGRAH